MRATPFRMGQMAIVGRRNFIAALGGIAFAWSLAARAQQADRMRRVGVLLNRAADDPEEQARVAAFLQRLQELGWTDGRSSYRVRRCGVNGVKVAEPNGENA